MKIRKIRPEEYKRCQQLCALAFEYPLENAELSPEATLERIRQNPRSMQDIHWDSQYAAFADDDQTMLATMTVIPWSARFDGHAVTMGGIGGVASLPQHRRGGAIRGCFGAALRNMYDEGMALSYLYPFSAAFYRRFGYELGCDWVKWRLKLAGLPATEPEGHWALSEPGNPRTQDIREIDRIRESLYNCMVLNGDTEYLYLEDDPFVTKRYTYIYYDAEGRPRAHLTAVPGGGEIDCVRFVFNDRQGLLGLLALLRRFSADHSHATFRAPAEIDLRGVLPEWSFGNVSRTLEQRGLVRAVNAETLLKLARTRGEGRLRIAIKDEQLPENSDCFEITFASGQRLSASSCGSRRPARRLRPSANRTQFQNDFRRSPAVSGEPRDANYVRRPLIVYNSKNSVRRVADAPDIELTIQDFSRLITGCCDLDPDWLPDVQLHCPLEQAEQVFFRKPTYISSYF